MQNGSFPPYQYTETSWTNSTGDNESSTLQLKFTPVVTGVVVFFTLALTCVVILGNALIIISVRRVHKLRKNKSNYLLASLAVCDMLVGLTVMPIAILPEVLTEWPLGTNVCFMWVTFDVTLCTCSILHIMLIAVDRYCIITSMHYETNIRTGKVIFGYILAAWFVSILISSTPAFLNWLPYHGENGRGCFVNQKIEYQMYATFVAFYLPLIVKLCLYGKLFMISRRLVRAEAKNHPQLGYNDCSSCGDKTSTPSGPSSCRDSPVIGTKNISNGYKCKDMIAIAECTPLNSSLSINVDHHIVPDVKPRSFSLGESDWPRKVERHHNNEHLTVYHSQHLPVTTDSPKHSHRKGPISMAKRLSVAASTRISRLLHHHEHKNHKNNMAAIRTLGAIMGLFTVCWLPFFVLAVVAPLCQCKIPDEVHSVFLWVGYANSCFNPFIYAQFNREFRTPFKEILCCRCRTVDDSVRHFDYIEKYGGENEH